MQFTIVGAGALGTILGAHLVEAGHDVTVLARGARAADVEARGLRVTGLATFAPRCRVLTDPADVARAGVLVYAVKTYHMEDALAGLANAAPEAVLSLANGVMKNEQLARVHGAGRVLGCMANFSGELAADGEVNFTRNVRLALGALPDYAGPAPGAIVEAIDAAGITSELVADIESVEWSKFTGWVALFALSLIARAPTGVFLSNPHFARVCASMVRETAGLAAARGIALVDQSPMPVATVARAPLDQAIRSLMDTGAGFEANAPGHRMSSLQDLEAGRRLEVEETLGYAVREAEKLALPAPSLGLAYHVAAGLDALARRS